MIATRDATKFVLMSNFFEELQRRKVYRVAAAYIIAAGFIIQIGSAFPGVGVTKLDAAPGGAALTVPRARARAVDNVLTLSQSEMVA